MKWFTLALALLLHPFFGIHCLRRIGPRRRFAHLNNDSRTLLSFKYIRWVMVGFLLTQWPTTALADSKTLEGHKDKVLSVAFSPDRKSIASGGQKGTIYVWDLTTCKIQDELDEGEAQVLDLAFVVEGKELVSACMVWEMKKNKNIGRLRWWNIKEKKVVREVAFESGYSCFAASSDGKKLATGSGLQGVDRRDAGDLILWDMKSGKQLGKCCGLSGDVNTATFSQDGELIAGGDHSGEVRIWDTNTRKEVAKLKLDDVQSLAFSPDKKFLAANENERLAIVELATGKKNTVLRAPLNSGQRVVYLPGGQSILTTCVGLVTRVDILTRKTEAVISETAWIQNLAISTDGEWVAACCRESKMIEVRSLRKK